MRVVLYALSTCPYCRMAKKYLTELGADYELHEVDLLEGDAKDAAVAAVKELTGGSSFPVLQVGDETVVGFDKKRMKELLAR